MRVPLAWAAAMAVGLAVSACSLPTVDKQSDAIARHVYDEVRTGADVDADPNVAHELKNPTTAMELNAMRGLIPAGDPKKVENRAISVNVTSVGTTTHLTHAYVYDDRTVYAYTTLFKSPGGKTPVVVGFNLTLEPPSGGDSSSAGDNGA
ncbi:MAG: hypothetical protein ACHP84_08880 [Caulobacterales bacterium]|jgi:hypothetical protein